MQIKDPIIFVAGAAIGAVGAWFFTKKYYQEKADEEIESVKESFKKLQEDAQKRADAAKNKPDLSVYVEALNKSAVQTAEPAVINYSGFTEEQEVEEEVARDELLPKPLEPNVDRTKPYLINRLPYSDEDPDYTQITVMYYADGKYADMHGRQIEIEEYIGTNLMGYVEETDKDEVFIRNEDLGIDIDICKDDRSYEELYNDEFYDRIK